MNISEAMDKARRVCSNNVDRIYYKLDAGTIEPESALEQMASIGIPREVAVTIIEEATGLVFDDDEENAGPLTYEEL